MLQAVQSFIRLLYARCKAHHLQKTKQLIR